MTTQEMPHGPSASPPGSALARMINGYWLTQMIYTATRLGIADALAGGPQTAGRLAERCGAHARSLHRLLRALASHGDTSERDAIVSHRQGGSKGVPVARREFLWLHGLVDAGGEGPSAACSRPVRLTAGWRPCWFAPFAEGERAANLFCRVLTHRPASC